MPPERLLMLAAPFLRRYRNVMLRYYRDRTTVTVLLSRYHEIPMNDNPAPAPLSPIVFHILLAMSDGHEHGYAIGKAVEETSGLPVGPGTTYGSLQRMERDGLVVEAAARPGDRRKPFVMTEEGQRALAAEAARIDRLATLARDRDLVPGADIA